MSNYNNVILMGNLTRDPDLKFLQSGTAVRRTGIAASRSYTDGQTRRTHDVYVARFSFVLVRQGDDGNDARQEDIQPESTSGVSKDEIPF